MLRFFKLPILIAVLIFILPILSAAQTSEKRPEVQKIIEDIDRLYRSNSSYSEVEMTIVTPHWKRTLGMKVWTEGMEKTFIRLTSPEKEKGVATLRIKNEMWNYLPKINKVIKIPPSMMMNSWMGSDFTNDDLVKEYSLFKDYDYEYTTVENPADSLYYIKCIPHKDVAVVWGSIIIAARKTDYIPIWEKYYDDNGNLARTLYFKDVQNFDGRSVPAIMEMVPEEKEGHSTTLKYNSLKFDIGLDQDIFTLRNLRSE
jgi:outer membrane lipoprotein-sorting protein